MDQFQNASQDHAGRDGRICNPCQQVRLARPVGLEMEAARKHSVDHDDDEVGHTGGCEQI